nr:MAG TPA: hypothetical protein [Caudoviricetes sp.]
MRAYFQFTVVNSNHSLNSFSWWGLTIKNL